MKESEYIDATDLAKLRAAYVILGETVGKGSFNGFSNRKEPILFELTKWIEELELKLRGKLEEE